MSRKIVRRLTQVEVVKMGQLLHDHVSLLPKETETSPQLCEYEEGWDDDRIAKEIAADLTAQHAGNLRMNMFGRLFVKSGNDLAKRVEELERKLTEQGAKMAELISKHDKLCATLTLERTATVNHLKMHSAPPQK